MTTHKVGYFIGSLGESYQQLAKALVRLAPGRLRCRKFPSRLPVDSYV